jgi:hypothetical protein
MLLELAHSLRNVDPDRPAVLGSISRTALADLADGYALRCTTVDCPQGTPSASPCGRVHARSP